jgi:hypothetical protein
MVARKLYTIRECILSFPKIYVDVFFTFRRGSNLVPKTVLKVVEFEVSQM